VLAAVGTVLAAASDGSDRQAGCAIMSRVTDLDPASVLDALARDDKLRAFLRDGRIEVMPAKRSRRLLLLNEIARAFEPGVRYPESAVNRVLAAIYPDYAALRRYLVDEQLMDRAGGEYWRSGGPVP
jgi:hypothetical protein